jgi:hypothetical protein
VTVEHHSGSEPIAEQNDARLWFYLQRLRVGLYGREPYQGNYQSQSGHRYSLGLRRSSSTRFSQSQQLNQKKAGGEHPD